MDAEGEEGKGEGEESNDLKEHMVGILFSRSKLTHLQKQVSFTHYTYNYTLYLFVEKKINICFFRSLVSTLCDWVYRPQWLDSFNLLLLLLTLFPIYTSGGNRLTTVQKWNGRG